jgi:hypothetical protein
MANAPIIYEYRPVVYEYGPESATVTPGGIFGGSSAPPLGLQSGQGTPGAPHLQAREVAKLHEGQLVRNN